MTNPERSFEDGIELWNAMTIWFRLVPGDHLTWFQPDLRLRLGTFWIRIKPGLTESGFTCALRIDGHIA